MMKNWIIILFFIVFLGGAYGAVAQNNDHVSVPDEQAYSAFGVDPYHHFDFWLGEWQVMLRIHQADGTWPYQIRANTHIYSILDGKAVLELWDSPYIRGYSLRYYDPEKQKWVLWLSWPQANSTSVSKLEGGFTHGRGDFESERTDKDGNIVKAVYSFSDITPFSLRWDDAYSKDGGQTWSHNWRMEFSRIAARAQFPESGPLPTMYEGTLCNSDTFLALPQVPERATGSLLRDGQVVDVKWRAYKINDGCATIAFIEGAGVNYFIFNIFNTKTGEYETHVLDSTQGTPLRRFTGENMHEGLNYENSRLVWGDMGLDLNITGAGGFSLKLTPTLTPVAM